MIVFVGNKLREDIAEINSEKGRENIHSPSLL